MNVLVTGATGFIGRHLVRALSEKGGYNVFCLVRSREKAERVLPPGVTCVYGDITDRDSLKKAERYDIGVLFHCAGYVENSHPELLQKINVQGTHNACSLAAALNVERMVYTSSVAVISGHTCVPLTEDLPYKATNIYGQSKIEAEKHVRACREKGLRVVIIRPPMVYGEGEPHLLAFLLRMLRLRLLPLMDGGRAKLHLAYVKNIAEAMIFSLSSQAFLEGTFFVADREVLTQKEIFSLWARALGVPAPWEIPGGLTPLLLKLPGIGRKLSFFLKDRVYSTDRITAAGFVPPYPAPESLVRSARGGRV